jgi:hypothetical protein
MMPNEPVVPATPPVADPDVRYVWHEGPVPAGLPVTQVYGWLLCPVTEPGRAPIAQVRMAGTVTEFAARAPDADGGGLYRRR